MLSQASVLPRVCLSCRLGLALRRATRRPRATPPFPPQSLRRYSSDYAFDSAEAYEAKLTELVNKEYYHDFLIKKNLELESLGKPVTALIIKNPNEMRSRPTPLPVLDEEAPSTGTPLRVDDVLPQEEESDSKTLEEAIRNIDELRPSDTDVLRLRELENLVGALYEGFTWEQLNSYCVARNPKPRSWAKEASPYPWIVEQQPWEAVRMVQLEKLTPKRQIAAKIITKLWNIGVREQVRGPGRTLVWFRPSIFELLFRPSSQLLQTLTTECLGGSKQWKITPSPRDSRLEIYSPKATARTILARIDEMVQSMMTRHVPVKPLGKVDMSRAVLNELERITNTLIRYKANDSELSISWVADNAMRQPNEPREQKASTGQRTQDPADVVLLLLLAQQVNPHPSEVDVISSFEREQPVGGNTTFVSHHRGNRAMLWNDKMRQWSRRVNPTCRRDSATPLTQTSIVDKMSLPNPVIKTKEGLSMNRITATFGHVLHSRPAPPSNPDGRRRVLSPVVPHPASFTSVGVGSDKPVVQSTAIILHFSPENAQRSHKGKRAPALRLKLPIDPDSDLSKFTFPPDSTLEGVLAPWHMSDVLLPDERVDVRLFQQRVLSLDASQPSLKEFLATSEFNLLAGRLRTPTKSSKPDKPRKAVRGTKRGGFDEPAEPLAQRGTDTPYLFVGLEIHQMVDLELDGYTLRYNSIEAGHQGGQRQEISLVADSDLRSGKPDTAETANKFLQAVEDVAFGKLFSWHKGNKMVQDQRCVEDELDWETVEGVPDAHMAIMQQMGAGEAELPVVEEAYPLQKPADAGATRGAAEEEQSPSQRPAGAVEALEPASEKATPSSKKPTAARGVEDPDWVTQLRSMVRRD
ncbi:mitochondrial inner-membrane-bound regulator [Hirsutella rhossiliensis]|uniref:Mitochondrial inner-membrane-bound regulator n=1 Tax=Hirsutella rhossiliensis TaxID=111463 RepID=A0A9P8N0C3_9HYPO|nr:mitochondrial inner-membrane-bound regulator [Hirsutella rhossiliensis]KAH0964282.1 mitochondrial inner-membrane-bound regulator [Hirsutella rhossiliensis]